MSPVIRHFFALLAAAIATGTIASIIQTQLTLQQLASLGAPVTASVRAWTTLHDLASFGPVMAGIAVAALLFAIGAAHAAARLKLPAWRTLAFACLAACALWCVFWLMRFVIPMPALPGTRTTAGHVLMSLAGIAGGLTYARLASQSGQPEGSAMPATRRRRAGAAVALLGVPALAFLVMMPRAGSKPEPVDPASFAVRTVAAGLDRPWSVAFLPDGRTLVTEMRGRLLAIAANGKSSQITLDGLPPIFHQGGTAGLMEVALDPQFDQNKWIYLTMGYGDARANGTRLVRARLAGDRIEDVRILFSSTPKPSAGNNGGRIAFLRDGTLVLSLGDGSARREEAQNIANHLGTLVRLNRDGTVPADNPFARRPGAAPEIYSLGHRNVQGIAVDPATGDLLISEHGPRGGDEINHIVAGGNYGWPVVSMGIDYPFARVSPFRQLDGYLDPLLAWTPSIAPAGLAVVDGPLFPQWRGDLLVPALRERAVRRVLRDGRRIVGQQLLLGELNERIRDVKVAPDGSIHVLTDGIDARLLRLTPARP